MTMAHVVYRVVTDQAFAARLQQDPEVALAEAGLALEQAELLVLLSILGTTQSRERFCTPVSSGPGGALPWGPAVPYPAAKAQA